MQFKPRFWGVLRRGVRILLNNSTACIQKIHINTTAKIKVFERHLRIHAIAAHQIDGGIDGQLRFKHARDQLNFVHQRAAALIGKVVARGIKVEHARNQHDQSKQIKSDDLAGERGFTKMKNTTPLAALRHKIMDTRRHKIVAKNDATRSLCGIAHRFQITHIDLGVNLWGNRHGAASLIFVVAVTDTVQRFDR